MSEKNLYRLWAVLYVVCVILGFLPQPEGGAFTALSVLFFLPPLILLYRAKTQGRKGTAALIRNLSALSLILTLGMLILNIVCAVGSQTLGNALHAALNVISAPMIASDNWALSLFLWACLLIWGQTIVKEK